MNKKEIESILLINKYLLLNDVHEPVVRDYLTHKVSTVLKNKAQQTNKGGFSIFSILLFF